MRARVPAIVASGVLVAIVAALVARCDRGAPAEAPPAHRAAPRPTARVAEAPAALLERLGQRGVAPRRIAGRVRFRGAAVAGAEVRLGFGLTYAGALPAPTAVTGGDGRFDLGAWPAASYRVVATAEGRAPGSVTVDTRDVTARPASDELVVELGACVATATGIVRDATGGVIAAARLSQLQIERARADGQGRYELCLGAGEQQVLFAADGYGSVVLTFEGRGALRRDVVLVPEATLVVRVVAAEGGAPVPDAEVSAWPFDWTRDRAAEAWGLSDEAGRVELRGLAAGRYNVWATARPPGGAKGRVDVVLEAARSLEVELRVDRHAVVSGTVVAQGKPVAGARVVARSRTINRASAVGVSQEDGRFALDEVPLGEVRFEAPPFEVLAPERLAVAGDRDGVVLGVVRAAAIRGSVTRLGAPVAGARVIAGALRATSRPDGSYELDGLAAGPYEVRATSPEEGAKAAAVMVTVARGETREGVDLELADGGVIAGSVVDAQGAPVAGARVVFSAPGDQGGATTAEDGTFACDALRGGRYRPSVFLGSQLLPPAGGEHPEVALASGASRAEVKLAVTLARRAIAGRAIDGSGAGVADARVTAVPIPDGGKAQPAPWNVYPTALTDADGAFRMGELADGRYEISVRSADGAGGAAEAAAGASGVVVTLRQAGGIAGQLVGFARPPRVAARRLDVEEREVAGTVAGSTFRVAPLVAGTYVVTAQSGPAGAAERVVVAPGREAAVTLTSRGAGVIEGVVRELPGGTPVPGVLCMASVASGTTPGTHGWGTDNTFVGDDDGHFVIDPSPAGPVHVHCYQPGDWSLSGARALIEVPAGGRATAALGTVRRRRPGSGDVGLRLDGLHAPPLVVSVTPASPAAAAGLRPGDVILSVDGIDMTAVYMNGVGYLLTNHDAGDAVPFVVARGAARLALTLRVEAPRMH